MNDPLASPLLSGSLREIPLADVLQLLELGRRSGLLHVHATGARGGTLRIVAGGVADARLDGSVGHRAACDESALRDVACALLDVRLGTFSFVPDDGDDASAPPAARLRVEALLVEAARRADEWARLQPWVPGPDAVPVLPDAAPDDDSEPIAPCARLWALLGEVDGVRDVAALAAALGRDPLALAADCCTLVRAGLLRCEEGPGTAGLALVPSGRGHSSLA